MLDADHGSQSPRTLTEWLMQLWRSVLFPADGVEPTAIRLASLMCVLVLPALLLYPRLDFLLLEPDEGRYAQIPREMHDRGEWVVPTLQGEPYLDKPPLMYWLVRISYAVFGVNETAARLVPALCVQFTILAVYLIGRRSVGERAAFWAAVILSVAPGYVSVARLLLLDGLLTLCITTSVLCGFEAVRTGSLKLGWWVASAICSGLGFLTKGPIAEVLLFPPLFAFAFLNGQMARVGWWRLVLFAGIVLGISTPWYIAIYIRQPEFLKYFFWEHNVMRFLQPFDHLQPVWYYIPLLIGGFLPALVLVVPYLRGFLAPSLVRTQAGGFWLLTGLWCVFFFSCSGSKLPTYILPAFPPLCLALGEFIARTDWHTRMVTRGAILACAIFLFGVHTFGLPWYARERSPMGRPELVEQYVNDPNITVVTYPRNCDSVAFYTGRSDLVRVRTKDVNQMIVDSHFRPRTVVLFTHAHSFEAFREALPSSVRVAESFTLKRDAGALPLADKLVGKTPWGLCDIAVLEPVQLQTRAQSP